MKQLQQHFLLNFCNLQTKVGTSTSKVWARDGLVYESASTGSVPEHVDTDNTQSCILFSNSTVQCVGLQYITESGGTSSDRTWAMDEFSDVTSLSAGDSSSHGMCVMVEDNKALFCWGKKDKHQMARGYTLYLIHI